MNEGRIIPESPKYKAIQYRNGWQMISPKPIAVTGRNVIGAKRGKVTKFTKAARRRLAHALLSLDYDRGLAYSVTLTIPGCNASAAQVKKAFVSFSRTAAAWDWSAIWRMELQRRGMIHYHLWLGIPHENETIDGRTLFSDVQAIRGLWGKACDTIGELRHDLTGSRQHISEMIGFSEYGTHVTWSGSDDKAEFWFRYLASHAMKDGAQDATDHGRHWGIIGRKGFTSAKLREVILTEQEHAAICQGYHDQNKGTFLQQFERWRAKLTDTLTPEQQARLDRWQRWLENGGKREGTFTFFGRSVLDRLILGSDKGVTA